LKIGLLITLNLIGFIGPNLYLFDDEDFEVAWIEFHVKIIHASFTNQRQLLACFFLNE
jgi:hypothetical protein